MRLKYKGMAITIPDKLIKDCKDEELKYAIEVILSKCEAIKPTKKEQAAAIKANELKIKRTKEKIQNAINLLRISGLPITIEQIHKHSGVAKQTIKKYYQEPSLFNSNE